VVKRSSWIPIWQGFTFPVDFVFRLTAEEDQALRRQIGISKGRGGRRLAESLNDNFPDKRWKKVMMESGGKHLVLIIVEGVK